MPDLPPSRIWFEFFASQGANQNLSAFSIAVSAARIPRNCHWEIVVPDLRPSRIWFEFLPLRVRTKTCALFFLRKTGASYPP